MSRFKFLRFVLSALFLLTILVAPAGAASAAPPPARGIHVEKVGHPTWTPVDFHILSAPIGTAASGYAEFGTTASVILPPPYHLSHPELFIGPGAPHLPPYTSEMAQGVANSGFHQGTEFKTREFSNGNGVWLVWMVVPTPGKTGCSPDFKSGPIIPNNLFPIHHQGQTFKNDKLWNPYLAFADAPALTNTLNPPVYCLGTLNSPDGHSHFPMFYADNADFGPVGKGIPGEYAFKISMIDTRGNGWNITAEFEVTK